MYIKKIKITNIRCFKEIEIDLMSGRGIRKWFVFLGDNSTGKTTFLRTLAMGLCDATSSAGLSRELYGEWIRTGEDEGSILVEFKANGNRKDLWIKTIIKGSPSGYSEVSQITEPEIGFPWEKIFVCGYGAARRAFGTKEYDEYSTIDAVYTLFNYDSPLQSPELILRRLSDIGINRNSILRWLEHILMLPKKSLRLGKTGLEVSDLSGKVVPLRAAGDGYQATISWIIDMLSWAMMFDEKMFKRKLSGIVLIDEIEQHLHPRWQKRIIKLLHEKFQSIQFICTTHAPLCVVGTTDLSDRDCELILFRESEDHVEALEDIKPPRGFRADQVLTSYLFGLDTTSDDATKIEIEEYSQLLSKKHISSKDSQKLRNLRLRLNKKLGSEETDLERRVAAAIRKELERRPTVERALKKKSISYEIRRQLRNLLGVKN
jgi:predicted ATPase